MQNKAEISINIPTDARSRNHAPYIEHTQFIKYCKANNVTVNECALEAYEKRGLLYPCVRLLYPRELLRRDFRASHPSPSTSFKVRDEWKPLIQLEQSIQNCNFWMHEVFKGAMEKGHPFEWDFIDKKQHPFVLKPEKQKFKAWKRYKVIIGKIGKDSIKKSRAVHYYSPWKIFFLHELNQQNTDTYNRATGIRSGWGIFNDRPIVCRLDEFIPFFKTVRLFAYRRNLYESNYDRNTQHTQQDWDFKEKKLGDIAERYFKFFPYDRWVRFLRKLIEIYEESKESEKILLSEEAKSFVGKTVGFFRFATRYDFQEICDDVSGKFINSRSRGREEGVMIYQGSLEALFPDEKWDLEKNVSWILEDNLKTFNSSLQKGEHIPESLHVRLFSELAKEPQCTALAAIRKINKSYWEQDLWCEHDIWSGIRDLAISIEGHGKNWLGGNRQLDGILKKYFDPDYSRLRRGISLDAGSTGEFIKKLDVLLESQQISENKRCGKHLLIAHLVRNFSTHNLSVLNDGFHKNTSSIYIALIRTLFVIYARHIRV